MAKTQALTGGTWGAKQTSSYDLADALFAAALVAYDNEHLPPLEVETLRVFHNISDEGLHEILMISEGM